MNLLDTLNDKQKEAVQSLDGFYRVIAGAGSGKTKTLTHRFAWLVKEIGVPSGRILCVTFTNKAANEMKDRISNLLQEIEGLNMSFVCTFHSFCVKVLRQEIGLLGLAPDFKILDVEDQKLMMKEMYKRHGISAKEYPVDDVLHAVDVLKVGSEWVNPVLALLGRGSIPITPVMSETVKMAVRYIDFQREMGGLDFNDLITFTTFLFMKYPDVRKRWSSRFDYIMVDETQDNSLLQWMLLDFLSDFHKNLYVVGDPDQAIYSFRGAKPDFLVSLDKKYACKTIVLDRNYRSTPVILNAANNVISHNRNRVKKDLYTNKDTDGDLIQWYHADDSDDESAFVAKTVQRLLAQKVDPREIAVLFRISALSRSIEQAFIMAGIPYQVYGGTRFFERQEIKDTLAYLSLLVNDDDVSFLRVVNKPARQLGDSFVSELSKLADSSKERLFPFMCANLGMTKALSKPSAKKFVSLISGFRKRVNKESVSKLLKELLDESGYIQSLIKKEETERYDNILELIGSIKKYEEENSDNGIVSINQYLQDISLFTNMDTSEKADSVKLMTIHQSKGLEFQNVFVIGFNENVLPSIRALLSLNKTSAIEEERRLAYVAITRAKSRLYISDVSYSYRGDLTPSRFLAEIDKRYIEQVRPVDDDVLFEMDRIVAVEKARTERRHLIFVIGAKVRHPVYGIGFVVDRDDNSRMLLIQFREYDDPIFISYDFEKLKLLSQYNMEKPYVPVLGAPYTIPEYGTCRITSINSVRETLIATDDNGNDHERNWELFN